MNGAPVSEHRFLRVGRTFLIRPQQPVSVTERRSEFLPAEHVHHSLQVVGNRRQADFGLGAVLSA